MKLLQVTIGAGVTQFSPIGISARQVIVQNNTAHAVRVGDKNTTAAIGVSLAISGGTLSVGPFDVHAENLKNWYAAGTNGDVIDVLYVG